MRTISGAGSVARRIVVVLAALVIGWSVVASPVPPSGAVPVGDLVCGFSRAVNDDGADDDLVVGVPGHAGGGIVDVRTPKGVSRTLSPLEAGTNRRFGAAVAVVGLDGDGCNDLVVGAPEWVVPGRRT